MGKINSKMMDTDIRFDDTSRPLEKLRVKILFEQSWSTQVGAPVLAALCCYLVRHKTSLGFLEMWIGVFFLSTTVRLFVIRHFSHFYIKLARDFDARKWENTFAALAAVGGVIWGVAVCGAFPVGDLPFDCLMGYILAGVTAGAAVAYSTSLKATYSFFLPTVIPFAVRLALKGDEAYWGMSLMLLSYAVLFLKLTHQFNKYAVNSIVLSFQKDQLIERIRLMQSQVTESAQMAALGRMAGGMAHEINNPLGVILASSSMVEEYLETGNLEKLKIEVPLLLAKSDHAAERIAQIVKELRFFAGRPGDEQTVTASIKQLVEMAGNFCQERFKVHKILFNMGSIPSELLLECRPFHLTQVILNLLNNSYDAVCDKKDRWIRIEVFDLGERIEVAVTDSGMGIPEEIRKKIMEPFFSTKDVGKGMGLGLSISKGIVDSHQGELRLDIGSPNTRFIMTLPKTKNINSSKSA